jgi:excisionase family DNA binding protein
MNAQRACFIVSAVVRNQRVVKRIRGHFIARHKLRRFPLELGGGRLLLFPNTDNQEGKEESLCYHISRGIQDRVSMIIEAITDRKTPAEQIIIAKTLQTRKGVIRMETRRTVSVFEASVLLGVSKGTAYKAVHSGELPTIKIGRRILVPMDALERLLEGSSDD